MRHLKIYLLLAIFTNNCVHAKLNGQAHIDSLLKELPRQKEDTDKVNVLSALSLGYCSINPDEGIKYGKQGMYLATKLGWKKRLATINNTLANNYGAKSDFAKALEYYFKALMLHEETGNKKGIAGATCNIGNIYYAQGDLEKALGYYFRALKLDEEGGYRQFAANVSTNIGSVYNYQGEYAKALEYFFKALKVFEEMGDKNSIANAAVNIGMVLDNQSDYPKALDYYFKSLKLFEETGNKKGIAQAMVNIGNDFKHQSDYPKALEYYFKSLKLFEELGDKQDIALVTEAVGGIYLTGMKDYPKALEYYFRALTLCDEIGDKMGFAGLTGNIGSVYSDGYKDYPKALEYFFKSLKLDEELGSKNGAAQDISCIGNVYANQKNYAEAVVYYERALKLSEELGAKNMIASNLNLIGGIYISMINDTALKVNSKGSNPDKWVRNKEWSVKGYERDVLLPQSKAALLSRAINYLERSLAIGKEIKSVEVMKPCYENLAEAYKLSGNYKKSLEASDNYHAITDSVFSQENREDILKMGMKNEYERQRLTDSLKTVEKEKIAAINLQKQKSYKYMGIAGIVLLAGFSFFIVKERGKSESERKKSDGLLLNILPTEVADELKTNGTTTAKHYDHVTVLFTDFVNFTEAGERMSAQGLIDELHACFKMFDEITHKYNIEKIKTIGDAYLAVCGLPSPDVNHAENIVHAATEINAFMQDRLSKMGSERTFRIRIGIHSGSVVAGIVGVKKFAYDIWGDTVNTAARMEQNSEAGKINISETTYELVKDKFSCEYRGEVEAKGKGVMKMYFVS